MEAVQITSTHAGHFARCRDPLYRICGGLGGWLHLGVRRIRHRTRCVGPLVPGPAGGNGASAGGPVFCSGSDNRPHYNSKGVRLVADHAVPDRRRGRRSNRRCCIGSSVAVSAQIIHWCISRRVSGLCALSATQSRDWSVGRQNCRWHDRHWRRLSRRVCRFVRSPSPDLAPTPRWRGRWAAGHLSAFQFARACACQHWDVDQRAGHAASALDRVFLSAPHPLWCLDRRTGLCRRVGADFPTRRSVSLVRVRLHLDWTVLGLMSEDPFRPVSPPAWHASCLTFLLRSAQDLRSMEPTCSRGHSRLGPKEPRSA